MNRSIADVDQEDVDWRLRRSDHILCWRYEVYYSVIQLRSLPAVGRLVRLLVPIEEAWDFVRQVAHRALPSISAFYEGAELEGVVSSNHCRS